MAKYITIEGEERDVFPQNKKTFKLGELQKFVEAEGFGGQREHAIEIVPLPSGKRLVANERGKLICLAVNTKATALWKKEYPIAEYPHNNDQLIVGNVVICTPEEVGEFECDTCEDTGFISRPAENRGGNIVGPDEDPCPDCGRKEEDDMSGATDGDR